MGTNAVQGKPCFGDVVCVHGVRAKLSILKSGQDRLALQAPLSHCESVKCLDNRHTDTANWQPGRGTEQQTRKSHSTGTATGEKSISRKADCK